MTKNAVACSAQVHGIWPSSSLARGACYSEFPGEVSPGKGKCGGVTAGMAEKYSVYPNALWGWVHLARNSGTYSPSVSHCGGNMANDQNPEDKPWNDDARQCMPPPEPEDCTNQAGNPINFLSGHKLQDETVFEGSGDFPLSFFWMYNSFGNHNKSKAGYGVGESGQLSQVETVLHTEPPLGSGETVYRLPLDQSLDQRYLDGVTRRWRHNHSYALGHYYLPNGGGERAVVYRPNGSDLQFVRSGDVFVAEGNRHWRLTKDASYYGTHEGWTLRVENRIESYDTGGRIFRIENQRGVGVNYGYDDVGIRIKSIYHDNGDRIDFKYEHQELIELRRSNGDVYRFLYGPGRMLAGILFREEDGEHRRFHYEDPRFPLALTGVTDESEERYSTYTYDEQGRAIRSELSGGVDSLSVGYVDDHTRTLTNALGKSTTYHYVEVSDVPRIATIEGEASANCAAANRNYTYDTNGFIASQIGLETRPLTFATT